MKINKKTNKVITNIKNFIQEYSLVSSFNTPNEAGDFARKINPELTPGQVLEIIRFELLTKKLAEENGKYRVVTSKPSALVKWARETSSINELVKYGFVVTPDRKWATYIGPQFEVQTFEL